MKKWNHHYAKWEVSEIWTNACMQKFCNAWNYCSPAVKSTLKCIYSIIYERRALIFLILVIPICCITTIHINHKLSEQTISAKFLSIIPGSFLWGFPVYSTYALLHLDLHMFWGMYMYVCLVAMTFLMEEEGGILRCHGRGDRGAIIQCLYLYNHGS